MHLSIFENDAFSLESLSKAINDLTPTYNRIQSMGLFSEEGISTTTLAVERIGDKLSLVKAEPRGAPGQPYSLPRGKLVAMRAIHLPQRAAILADEVQNLRAFGKESEVETAQNLMNKKLKGMRRDLDQTIEYQRMGAIKGQVVDADGVTVLHDMFDAFDLTKTTHAMAITANNSPLQAFIAARRKLEKKLGGVAFSGVAILASSGFFDGIVGDESVKESFARWNQGEFLRTDYHNIGFQYAGMSITEYNASVAGKDFIPAGKAYMIPLGVADMFHTVYAPADYMETVNTLGIPYYVKQQAMDFNKGIEVESQSNPLHINTRPDAVVELSL